MASDGAGATDELMKDDETKVEKLPGLPIIVTLDQKNIMGGAYHRRHIRRNVGVLTLFRHLRACCVFTLLIPIIFLPFCSI